MVALLPACGEKGYAAPLQSPLPACGERVRVRGNPEFQNVD